MLPLFSAKIEDISEKDWELMINTNLCGPFFLIKYAVPYLSESKGGLTLMTKALAFECVRHGIITPEDVAKSVMFLAYNDCSETIAGANLIMDFGLTAGQL